MNKWVKQGLLYVSLFSVFSLMVGCFGLDDSQKTAATFVNAFFSKSDKPTAEVRYEKMSSVVSANFKNSPTNPQYKTQIVQLIEKFMKDGINKDYYIADHPTEPQTDTHRTLVVKFPANSFAEAEGIFGSNSSANKESYGTLILDKEDDKWKIVDLKDADVEVLQKAKIDWTKVDHTDYLN